ncbi:unnamed protein product [Peniophora sp. CBMAI 1063]|nr:unnamed protein product [Peniophora sp. CBMAI 1063]
MSFFRISHNVARIAARRFSTEAPKPKGNSNLPIYALVASATGFGAYYALGGAYSDDVPKAFKKAQEKSPLDPKEFKDFKLKKVIPYNDNTSTFVFELPDGEASLLPVASCLVIKSTDPNALVDDKGKPVIRPYTPVSPPDLPGELHLLIKKYETGKASKYVHEGLKPGDTLSIKGPIPKYPYKQNEFEEVALIGGGSGITPLWQVASHALSDPKNNTKFTLVFANVAEKDILMREQLDGLAKEHPDKFKVVYVLDKADGNWTGPTGYINSQLVKQYVPPADLKEKIKVFVCGPPGQVAAIAGKKDGMKQGSVGGILKELGYTEDQVYKF